MGADPRFFPARGPLSLAAIAEAAGAHLAAEDGRSIAGVAPLALAAAQDIAFCEGRRHLAALRETRAGAVLVAAEAVAEVPAGCAALVVDAPQLAFARVAALFHPRPAPVPGIHPSAVIAADATIGEGCEIGPFVVVGAGAEIGPGCILHPHAVVGPGCVLGAGSILRTHASLLHCIAGKGVVLHEGARVGNEGFGFVTTKAGEHVTVPQVGRVLLGDGVEIGTNACVDRGAGGDTVLGPGTRLDNLVQVGHNVKTGRGCVIVAHAGIAGSSELGNYVVIAAQAGITGHITLGDGARVGAQAGVMNHVPAGIDVVGSPAWPARETLKAFAWLRRQVAPPGGAKSANDKTGGAA
ncbi:UDP-3-O-(3-hydroxymyristoyl)glucosamine N-acyltransferase [Roseomonas sp. CECT 9278]|uniref:UDP-3-O-(3-hydroxymyristoyl)glucosamine N-acyltransferase n=1 Tax=Roseomonas sp. CECT 9278 TaxID=2845823 RepID=UPI001E4BE901|nr:UDP-3-O-(3-hydroxymyristoyl)glucosamine N-acyltransferase [Roseomonas sp. CECT 9278]CAH0271434.1 UDP-3-O-acylglucosamine N-acyltransferase [Roseomonas sp. CECT 9278]